MVDVRIERLWYAWQHGVVMHCLQLSMETRRLYGSHQSEDGIVRQITLVCGRSESAL